MNKGIISENERDFLAQMEETDRKIEEAVRADLEKRYPGLQFMRPFKQTKATDKMPPEHVNCRCTIVWPQEAAEEALNHG